MSAAVMEGVGKFCFECPNKIGDLGFTKNMAFVRDHDLYGRTFAEQVSDWKVLSKGPGKILFPDYFRYGLNKYFAEGEAVKAQRYIGKRLQIPLVKFSDSAKTFREFNDKSWFGRMAQERNISVPVQRYSVPKRMDKNTLREFLCDADSYPFFAKPNKGLQSIGTFLAKSLDVETIIMGDGTSIAVDELIEKMGNISRRYGGYVFQDVAENSDGVKEIVGETLATIRLVVYADENGVKRVQRGVWKMPLNGQMADNAWRGSMVSSIETGTGRILKSIVGQGRTARDITVHPLTGKLLSGVCVPGWDHVVSMVEQAAAKVFEINTQSWDVCITNDGPVAIEMNVVGDLGLVQLAYGKGMLTTPYLRYLKNISDERGLEKLFKQYFSASKQGVLLGA